MILTLTKKELKILTAFDESFASVSFVLQNLSNKEKAGDQCGNANQARDHRQAQ